MSTRPATPRVLTANGPVQGDLKEITAKAMTDGCTNEEASQPQMSTLQIDDYIQPHKVSPVQPPTL